MATTTKKKYRLPPDVEQELKRLLRPETDTRPVSVTLRFGYPFNPDETPPYSIESLPEQLKVRLDPPVEKSREIHYQATYRPEEYRALHEAYAAVADWPLLEVLIDHHRVPYSGNLWLPLLFFYLAEDQNPFHERVETEAGETAGPPAESERREN